MSMPLLGDYTLLSHYPYFTYIVQPTQLQDLET